MGVEAPEEAAQEHHPDRGMASQLRPPRGGIDRFACAGALQFHQGRGRAAGKQRVGGATSVQHDLRRVSEQFGWMGAWLCVFAERECSGLYGA